VICFGSFAQTQDSYEYQKEFTWGINKNTFGGLIGGFTFKKARKLKNDRILETYGIEIVNIKHPQEVRKNAILTNNLFIPGKVNYLYSIRLQYGRDLILFKKAPQRGAEIKAVFAAGPSLGLVSPYYVEYQPDNSNVSSFVPYNEDIPLSSIYGPGRLFQGIGDSKFNLGFNLKAAVNFELGTFKDQVTGFEAGFLLDAYSKKTEFIINNSQYSVFPTLFLTIFYGSRK
jgi:hypothetical protein